jgi:hypothetical protein
MSCCAACDLRAELTRLRHSTLLHAGGYGVYRGLIEPKWIEGMLAEAMAGGQRIDQVASGNDTEDIRGGQPARQIVCVEGGPRQDELFGSLALQSFVANEVKLPIRSCGMRASYSIYTGPQAHLDIHRDVPGCDLALITCLYDSDPLGGEGAVDLWLDDLTTPLREIRAHVQRRRSRLALLPGDSLLIHGGMIPHRIPPPGTDRLRVVSLMCFEIVA